MAKHNQSAAIEFAHRIEVAEKDRALRELQEQVAALQSRLVELAGPRPDDETPLERLARQEREYLAQWEAQKLAESLAAQEALQRAMDSERSNTLVRPQDPPPEALWGLAEAISKFIRSDSYRFNGACEHEKNRFLQWDALLEALGEVSRPGELWPGWCRAVPQAVARVTRAVGDVAFAWGWQELMGPDREERFGDLVREWDRRTGIPLDRMAELWLRCAEEGRPGFVWPDHTVEIRARDARARGLMPIPIEFHKGLPIFVSPWQQEAGFFLLEQDKVSGVYDDLWKWRANQLAVGKRRPTLDDKSDALRGDLTKANEVLLQAIPRDKPVIGVMAMFP